MIMILITLPFIDFLSSFFEFFRKLLCLSTHQTTYIKRRGRVDFCGRLCICCKKIRMTNRSPIWGGKLTFYSDLVVIIIEQERWSNATFLRLMCLRLFNQWIKFWYPSNVIFLGVCIQHEFVPKEISVKTYSECNCNIFKMAI